MNELVKRIRQGRAWLRVNSFDHCKRVDKPFDHLKYEQHLEMYKQLIEQLIKLGGDEDKCYRYQGDESLDNGKLADFEVEFILSYPELFTNTV